MPEGKAFAAFSVATSNRWKDAEGQDQTRTQFHRVKAFNGAAGLVRDNLEVGMKVHVEGEIVYSETEKDGRKFNNADIMMKPLEWFAGKREPS